MGLLKQGSLDSSTSSEGSSSCGSICRGAHKCLAILHGEGNVSVTALALSRGFMYAGCDRGEIRAWGHPAMRECPKFGAGDEGGAVKCLVVVGNKVISAHQDHKIRVWRSANNQHHRLVKTLPGKELFPNLLPAKSHSSVRQQHQGLWNANHHDSISSLAVGDGVLYSGSWDKTIKVWRISDFRCVESLEEHMDAVNALVADACNQLLYSGSGDATIKVFQRLPEGGHQHTLVATLRARSAVNALALSADGTVLYAGQSDRTVAVWRMGASEDGKCEWTQVDLLRGHRQAVLCLRAFGNGLVVSGSADKTVRVWRRGADGAHCCVAVMAGHTGPVKSLGVVSDLDLGAMVYSGSMDGDVRIWWLPEDDVGHDASQYSDGPVVLNWRSG